MFSEAERRAVDEKFQQLKRLKEGSLSSADLIDMIAERRIRWINENLDEMLEKYDGLSSAEKAYKIAFLDHMKINPKHSKIIKISKEKIRIESYNFCPYLEACQRLNLDTKKICREIVEPPLQKMIEIISPDLKFSRNYANIRPYNPDFCEEFIEVNRKE